MLWLRISPLVARNSAHRLKTRTMACVALKFAIQMDMYCSSAAQSSRDEALRTSGWVEPWAEPAALAPMASVPG
jgi:hypothetical protein